MADAWFRKLGFSRNPFSIKPAAFSYELFGVNADSVLSGIEDGKVMFVEAPLGYGKTTMLKGIIHRFGGRKKVIYANILPSEKLDVKELLKRSSLANYLTGNLANGMILVADEAQNLTPGNSAEVMELYKSGNLRAVVFFGTRYSRISFVEGLNNVMNGNIIRLSSPTPEQAISLVRGRIGNLPLLSNEMIRAAYRRANGNPRTLLQICDDLCRYAFEFGNKGLHPSMSPAGDKLRLSGEVSTPATATETAEAVQPAITAIAPVSVKGRSRAKAARQQQKRDKPKQQKNRQKNKRQKQAKGKSPPKSSKPSKASTPAAAATVKSTVSTYQQPESTEGSYWGEFMGMQK